MTGAFALWVVALGVVALVVLSWQTVTALRLIVTELTYARLTLAEVSEEMTGRLVRDLEHSARNIVGRVFFRRPPPVDPAEGDYAG